MFTALKKLVGSEAVQLRDRNIPAGLQSMNQSLQRRFAKGVQYNMKIVIRGDRNTGKSALWYRLQGKKFLEEYIPTQEIQVTSIHWNYKTTDDVVKVEVWDVVDKAGKGKRRGENLKLENEPQESETDMALDAEFLDVYKNCNGVILMFDITKQWTFNYILRELPKVPTHIPVCVLGNQRDMGEHRVILPDDIRDFINNLNRPPGSSYIHYAESSMKNGFGLKYLHRFFNIPFLQLQRETLLRQLETNQLDIDAMLEELSVQQETEDQNYDIFLEMMENRKAYGSPVPSNGQSPSSGSQSPVVLPGAASPSNSSPSTPQAPPPGPTQSAPPPPPSIPHPAAQTTAAHVPLSQAPSQTQEPPAPMPSTAQPAPPPAQKRGFMSRLFGSAAAETSTDKSDTVVSDSPNTSGNVDNFVPEVGLDRGFLEDGGTAAKSAVKSKKKPTERAQILDSDSDAEGRGNPLVSGFQDDLDPDDRVLCQPAVKAAVPSMGVTLTSDEEEDGSSLPSAFQNKDIILNTKGSSVNSVKHQQSWSKPVERPQSLGSVVQRKGRKTGGAVEIGSDSDDHDAPVAQQMLSFVMDDPDFESEELDIPKIKKEAYSSRNEFDGFNDGFVLTGLQEPPIPDVPSFKNDIDLFGLGFEDTTCKSKDSSDDPDDNESRHSKDKKKKKKKSKEEDDKSSKKRHKHKKKEKEESGTGDEKEKRKKKSKSKKSGPVDDLEAFLAGEGPVNTEGGDYEEL
ncbi:rab-like protein 6 isoform X1 [Triplophysa dalaica]|uniref:rab-like protein 6 isoform X1 n=1 Tax=Triplophysa dalaica TaxID=1582913 RepID=UPI0024DFD1EB|nr:rab-like protein 6 isoform X1 [Triplophysa dalaica]XP_056601680.1 rab-like protein 6 isoform X1 [Triplophysa dalaica]XP_056601681.1 rab-like protein 6 isoform X1 [Triplophysa dalaica]